MSESPAFASQRRYPHISTHSCWIPVHTQRDAQPIEALGLQECLTIVDLSWLAQVPDWSQRLSVAEMRAEPDWPTLVALANARLDFLQTDRLARLLARSFPAKPPGATSEPVRLAILGSATTAHLAGPIKVGALRRGLWVQTWEASYGQYRQVLTSGSPAWGRFEPNAILLCLDARHVTAGLDPSATPQDAELAFEGAMENFRTCWRAAQKWNALVLQQTFLPVLPPILGENEARLPGSRAALLDRINAALPSAAAEHGVHLVSAHTRAAQDGVRAWHDPVLWHRSKQEVSPVVAPLYGDLVARVLAAAQGRSRKALVIDLDNTIWGGVVGDDGVGGLELGQGSAEGEAFAAVQQHLRRLSARGVILAVCSKNNEATASEAFDRHPEMILKRGDIASFVANWDDKASNIKRIAEVLQLGLDAIVFLDDNAFERDLVRRTLPEVAVPETPEDDPAMIPQMLGDAGYFETLAITAEDRQRTGQYQTNLERSRAAAQSTDMDTYLQSLEMRLQWRPFDEAGLSRIVQLINKTNQFNLTARRTDLDAARRLIDDPEAAALQFRLLDRFGDNGVISIVVARKVGDDAVLDLWLMSCRVLGRGVEAAVLAVVADSARALGCVRLLGRYMPTLKNAIVADLYPRLGFNRLDQDAAAGGDVWFELPLDGWAGAAVPIAIEGVSDA